MATAKTAAKSKRTAKPLGSGNPIAVTTALAAHAAPSASGLDELFDDLTQSATKDADVKPTDKDRDIIQLKGQEAEVLDRFCQSKAWFDKSKGINEAARADLEPILMRNVVIKMVQAGRRIANPRFTSSTSKVMYQVKNTVNLKLPLAEEGKQITVQEFFEQAGIPKVRAELLAALFIRKTTLTIVPLTDLRTSNAPLAEKLMQGIKGLPQDECQEVAKALAYNPQLAKKVGELIAGLSQNERKDALRVSSEVSTVDDAETTISKMAAICKTPDELDAAMNAAKVGTAVSSATYDGDLMEAGRTLMELAPKNETTFFTTDKSYKAEIKGTTAVLSRGNGEHVLTKQCTDAGHARATCQKWVRNPQYLKETLATHR